MTVGIANNDSQIIMGSWLVSFCTDAPTENAKSLTPLLEVGGGFVNWFHCTAQNVEIMEEYERMYEEYLKIEEEVAHMTEPTPDVNVDIQSPHFRDCTCSKAMQNRERNAVSG